MSYTFRPAVRENTPLIIGIAGPTKSGKTYSALRVAGGLANGGTIAMINAEGPRGHQYADKFKYVACDLKPPFRPTAYTQALKDAAALKPAVVIIDSASHMHDGPGGVLEWHEEILDRIAGKDNYEKRQRSTFAAWVDPKAAENEFIYTMLGMECPVVLCFRAKEKIKIVNGKPVELGWQPIAGERVAFETIFTLLLPPHSKGVPDLGLSDMREPFDTLVPEKRAIDEELGRRLAEWARGGRKPTAAAQPPATSTPAVTPESDPSVITEITAELQKHGYAGQSDADKKRRLDLLEEAFGVRSWRAVTELAPARQREGLAKIRAKHAKPAPPAPADDDDGPLFGDETRNEPKQQIVTEIADEVEKWGLLTPEQRAALFTAKVGTEVLSKVDVAALFDLRKFCQKVTAKDQRALAELDQILAGKVA
jgi:hypothetical protein